MLFSDKVLESTIELDVFYDCLFYLTATIPIASEFEFTVVGVVDLDEFEYTCFEIIGLVRNSQRFEERLAKLHKLVASRVVFAEVRTNIGAYVDV